MSTLLLAVLLLSEPRATTPVSPAPASPVPPSPAPKAKEAKPAKGVEAAKASPAPKNTPPAKVLTNDDLEKAREGGAAVSVLKVEGIDAPPMDVAGAEVTEASAAQTTWRLRAQSTRTRISDAEARVADLEERLAALRNDMQPSNAMTAFREQERQAAIQARTEELEAARALLASARQAMADLEEEARKESVPPGWLREP